jgi:hypothetical protein
MDDQNRQNGGLLVPFQFDGTLKLLDGILVSFLI